MFNLNDSNPASVAKKKDIVEAAFEQYEYERYDRVKTVWDWEWKQAVTFHKTKKLLTPSPDYLDWLMSGV